MREMDRPEKTNEKVSFTYRVIEAAERISKQAGKIIKNYHDYPRYLQAFARKHDLGFILELEAVQGKKHESDFIATICLTNDYNKRKQRETLESTLANESEVTLNDLTKISRRNIVAVFESEPKFSKGWGLYRFLDKRTWRGPFTTGSVDFKFEGLRIKVMKSDFIDVFKEFCEDYVAITGQKYTLVNRLGNPIK